MNDIEALAEAMKKADALIVAAYPDEAVELAGPEADKGRGEYAGHIVRLLEGWHLTRDDASRSKKAANRYAIAAVTLRDAAYRATRLIEETPFAHENLTNAQIVLMDAVRGLTRDLATHDAQGSVARSGDDDAASD